MARHEESNAARENHIVPIFDIRPNKINEFLDAQAIPDAQKNVLRGAQPGIWRTAANQSWNGFKATTALNKGELTPHYDLRSAAMFILKHGPDKIAEMPQKIKEQRAQKAAKDAYNPLNIFSDRRKK
jgi:hypothetical protein